MKTLPPKPTIHSRASRLQQLSNIVNPEKPRYSSVPIRAQSRKEERSFDNYVRTKLAHAHDYLDDYNDPFRNAYKNLAINK